MASPINEYVLQLAHIAISAIATDINMTRFAPVESSYTKKMVLVLQEALLNAEKIDLCYNLNGDGVVNVKDLVLKKTNSGLILA